MWGWGRAVASGPRHNGGMSTGPGCRQQELLSAVFRAGGRPVWVVPEGASISEASAWRRAARALALKGQLKAVYLRRVDRSGRWLRHLAVVANSSAIQGDVYPSRSPGWIAIPPPILTSFSRQIQADLVEYRTGTHCSPRTITTVTREHLEQQSAA